MGYQKIILLISSFIFFHTHSMQVFKEHWETTPLWVKYCGAATCVGGYLLWDWYKSYKKDKQIEQLQCDVKKLKPVENPTEFIRSLSKPLMDDISKLFNSWKEEHEDFQKQNNALLLEIKNLVQEVKQIGIKVDDCEKDLTTIWYFVFGHQIERQIMTTYRKDKEKEKEGESYTGRLIRFIPKNETLAGMIKEIVEECLRKKVKRSSSDDLTDDTFVNMSTSPVSQKQLSPPGSKALQSPRRSKSCDFNKVTSKEGED